MTDPHEPKVPIAPVKFSFAKPKVSAAPPPVPLFPTEKPDKVHDVEYVTEFDGKGRKLGEAAAKIIPKLENSWRPEKRMKNIMVESDLSVTTEDRFETETLSAGPQPNVQYGLTLAAKKSSEESAGIEANGHAYSTGQQEAGLSFPELELQKLKADINSLPDETSLDAYENVPVEEFGEALLRGMGWEKGKPIGRNCKTVVVPIEHTKRVGREGLGAVPAPKVEKVKQYIKPGETRGGKLTVGKDERYNREGNFGTRNEGDDYVYTGKSESSKDKVVENRDESRANRKDHMSSEGHQRERYSYISGMSDKDVERSEVSKRRTDDRTRKYDDERCVKGDKSRTKRGKDDDVYSSKSKSRKDNRRENDAVESRDVSRSKWKDDTGSKGSRRDTDKDSKTRHHRQSDDRSGNHESKARSRRKEDDCTYSGKSKSSKDNRG